MLPAPMFSAVADECKRSGDANLVNSWLGKLTESVFAKPSFAIQGREARWRRTRLIKSAAPLQSFVWHIALTPHLWWIWPPLNLAMRGCLCYNRWVRPTYLREALEAKKVSDHPHPWFWWVHYLVIKFYPAFARILTVENFPARFGCTRWCRAFAVRPRPVPFLQSRSSSHSLF